MKLVEIITTRLVVRLKSPIYWAQNVRESFEVVLVEAVSDAGHVGIGEALGGPNACVAAETVKLISSDLIGGSPFDIAASCGLMWERPWFSRC